MTPFFLGPVAELLTKDEAATLLMPPRAWVVQAAGLIEAGNRDGKQAAPRRPEETRSLSFFTNNLFDENMRRKRMIITWRRFENYAASVTTVQSCPCITVTSPMIIRAIWKYYKPLSTLLKAARSMLLKPCAMRAACGLFYRGPNSKQMV